MHRRIARLPSAFCSNERGAIAILFAFSLFVLVGAVGAAVDYGYALSKRTKLQSAADAAALAAAKVAEATLGERKTIALGVFSANYKSSSAGSPPEFDVGLVDSGATVRVTAQEVVPTFLMQVLGVANVTINAEVDVPIAKQGFAEVVLLMDYSDSMIDSGKYIRMSGAAAKMVDTISDEGKNKNVRFALVPFSAVVRADIPPAHIRSDVVFDGCTMDRQYPHNTTEGTAGSVDAAKWGDHSFFGHDCGVVAAANLKVLPLTDDLDDVKSTLASFRPHLWTHIAAGAEFGWQVVSPDGLFTGARPYSDKKNVKAVILLTDGMQTTPGWGVGESRTVADAEANLRAICTGMKGQAIEVFTIGYDLTDSHTLSLLSDCASPGQHYASTDVDTGLKTIMASISNEIQGKMMRLAK